MTEKISGSAIAPGTITVTQISGSFNETSNASYAQANAARTQANTAYGQANTAGTNALNAYAQANNARDQANTARTQANTAYGQANSGITIAGNAYGAANNRVLKTGDTMTGSLNFNFSGANLSIQEQGGLAVIEMGGANGAFIDMKAPNSDDYDFRIQTIQGSTQFNSVGVAQVVSFNGANVNFDSGTLFVDSVANEVGIGTTTPLASLDVRGNVYLGGADTGPNFIAFRGTTGDQPGNYNHTYIGERIYGGSESSELLLFKGNDMNQDRIRLLAGEIRLDTFTSFLTGTFDAVGSNTAAVSTRLLIASNGNVGIGNTAPAAKVVVEYTANNFAAGIDIRNTNADSTTQSVLDLTTNDGTFRVGKAATAGGGIGFLYLGTADAMTFSTNAAERMRINADGNVGIGNTAPASKLTVAGTIESTTGGVKFPDGTTQTTAASAAADPIPSGTVMLFVQTAAPTGWTKSTTHNDKALRVVSGSVSTGGSVAFTSAFASQSVAGSISSTTQGGTVSTSVSGSVSGSVGSTTLSTSEMPSHGHSATDAGVGITIYDSSAVGGGPYGSLARAATQSAAQSLSINATGGGGSHNHSWSGSFSGSASSTFTGSSHGHTFTGTAINLAVQYVDVIIATKN